MSSEPLLTSDVIGLTKVAPFSRRGFMTASAAVTAGYTLAAGPVRADVIKTDTDGLTAGDQRDPDRPGWPCTEFAGTGIQEDRDGFHVIHAGCGDERPIDLRAGVDQKLRHLDAVGHFISIENHALKQGGMALRRAGRR